jgi:AraC-like DNA-binding protein
LIREHEGSLGQIALAVGYESESSFSKAFKRQYQKTPGQFRKERSDNRVVTESSIARQW